MRPAPAGRARPSSAREGDGSCRRRSGPAARPGERAGVAGAARRAGAAGVDRQFAGRPLSHRDRRMHARNSPRPVRRMRRGPQGDQPKPHRVSRGLGSAGPMTATRVVLAAVRMGSRTVAASGGAIPRSFDLPDSFYLLAVPCFPMQCTLERVLARGRQRSRRCAATRDSDRTDSPPRTASSARWNALPQPARRTGFTKH